MAIRADTLPAFVAFVLAVLVIPGPTEAALAEVDSADTGEYHVAAEDPGDTRATGPAVSDVTPLEEHPFFTTGSATQPQSATTADIVVVDDPWAEAFGASPPPVAVKPTATTADIVVVDDPWAEAFGASPPPVAVKPTVTAVAAVVADYAIDANDRTRHFLERFTGARRSLIGMWLERSGRYLGMIRDTLRQEGLPEDLAFTAMIESGFNPVAVSRAGAKGLWQFMAQTARRYGLRVDGWVDERLDPEKSTAAAAAYLRDLYNQFGSWALAQAAYNAGEMKVARAIQSVRSRDFWVLARSRHLHPETKDFVPQIHAATLIGREPDRYGFDVTGLEPHRFEVVTVPPSTDLRRLAASARLSLESLQALNPELYRAVTPPGTDYELKVPEGAETSVRTALTEARSVAAARARVAGATATAHVVRPGDTVSGIAKRYRVSVSDVRRWNGLANEHRIRPGDRLRVVETAAR
jgi:Transglycosylase SLT domain/LysM domain